MLKEKIVMSDKTQKMVDDNLHGSYFGIKRIYASEPIGIKGEPSIKKMLFPASLEDALELLKQRIQFSKAVNCGARVMIEGSPTQSVSSPTLSSLNQAYPHPLPPLPWVFTLAILTTLNAPLPHIAIGVFHVLFWFYLNVMSLESPS